MKNKINEFISYFNDTWRLLLEYSLLSTLVWFSFFKISSLIVYFFKGPNIFSNINILDCFIFSVLICAIGFILGFKKYIYETY